MRKIIHLGVKKIAFILFMLPITFLFGCLEDMKFESAEIKQPTPQISLPAINTSLSLSDLINADTIDYLKEGEDNSYRLYFNSGTKSVKLSDFFPEIPDQNYSESFTIPGHSLIQGQDTSINETIKIPFEFDRASLKQINFNSGEIYLEVNSQYDQEIVVDIIFPDSKNENGNTISLENLTIPANGSASRTISLNEASINMVKDNGTRKLITDIYLESTTSSNSGDISFTAGIRNIDFKNIIGYFNNINIPVAPNTVKIPFFQNLKNANIYLKPSITAHIKNSFGVPVQTDFSNVKVRNEDSTITLHDEGTGEFFSESVFPYPEDLNDPPAEKTYNVNPQTSNIEDVFSISPDEFYYDLDFTIGSETDSTHFLTKDSEISAGLEIEVPLEGSIKNLTLIDTANFDLGNIDTDQLEHLKVLLKTENGFPINVNLQINFMDEFYNLIRDDQGNPLRLFDSNTNILKAATIADPETGETNNTVIEEPVTATLDGEKIKKVKNAEYMLISANLSTVENGEKTIKLYSFYNLKLQMALQAKPGENLSESNQ